MLVTSASEDMWKPLEEALRHNFLPALTGRSAFIDGERDLLSLPAKLGGIGIANPTIVCTAQNEASKKISSPLIASMQKITQEPADLVHLAQRKLKAEVHQSNNQNIAKYAKEVKSTLPQNLQFAVQQCCEDGASTWLTTIPVKEYGFNLHKQAFRDALCLRYGWPITRTPSHCACGTPFSINHAFTCSKGAFPTIRHNRIRDLLANLLSDICPCVAVEPVLQPLSGEEFHLCSTIKEDCARLDVSAIELWDKSKTTAYFDVKVFNAHASSNRSISATSCYRKHELEKRRKYERRVIDVEHSTFTPFVMSTNGGMGLSATVTVKQIAALLGEKTDTPTPRFLMSSDVDSPSPY